MLAAMGIEQDKIEQIIEGNAETVSALQDKIDGLEAQLKGLSQEDYQAVVEENKKLKQQIENDKEQTAKKGKDYDALKQEFDEYKAEQERKEVRAKKEAAYKEILKDAGIAEKHFAKILKYSDVDGVELDEKGKITTAKDILKSIKEEWSDHIQQQQTRGTDGVETPPGGNSGGAKMTLEQIDAIEDVVERQKAIMENHELFGF